MLHMIRCVYDILRNGVIEDVSINHNRNINHRIICQSGKKETGEYEEHVFYDYDYVASS